MSDLSKIDPSHASSLHDVADELTGYLDEAAQASAEYRDRARLIVDEDQAQPDDKRYLAERKALMILRLSDASNALYLLD